MRNKSFPIYQTTRLHLSAITEQDFDSIRALFSDLKVMEFYDMEAVKNEQEAKKMFNFLVGMHKSGNGIRWALREADKGKLIGTCGFNSWNAFDHSAIIGYDLFPDYWGKGYASEVVQQMVELAFTGQLPVTVNRIEAFIMPANKGSEGVARKNGFIFEGCLRQKGYWAGVYHDMNVFSLLKEDYQSA